MNLLEALPLLLFLLQSGLTIKIFSVSQTVDASGSAVVVFSSLRLSEMCFALVFTWT